MPLFYTLADMLVPARDALSAARGMLLHDEWSQSAGADAERWANELLTALHPTREQEWRQLLPLSVVRALLRTVKELAQVGRQYQSGARAAKQSPPSGFLEFEAANMMLGERTHRLRELISAVLQPVELAIEGGMLDKLSLASLYSAMLVERDLVRAWQFVAAIKRSAQSELREARRLVVLGRELLDNIDIAMWVINDYKMNIDHDVKLVVSICDVTLGLIEERLEKDESSWDRGFAPILELAVERLLERMGSRPPEPTIDE